MQDNNLIYIIPSTPKPIKIMFDDTFVDCNKDMTITVQKKATLSEIADMFDMTVDEVLNIKFGIYEVIEE